MQTVTVYTCPDCGYVSHQGTIAHQHADGEWVTFEMLKTRIAVRDQEGRTMSYPHQPGSPAFEPGARVLLREQMGGIVIGPGFVPGEVKVLWDDGLVTHIRSSKLGACDE